MGVQNLVIAAVPLGVFKLCYYVAILAGGRYIVHLTAMQMQRLTFLALALSGQANVPIQRERRRFCQSLPAPIMLGATSTCLAL